MYTKRTYTHISNDFSSICVRIIRRKWRGMCVWCLGYEVYGIVCRTMIYIEKKKLYSIRFAMISDFFPMLGTITNARPTTDNTTIFLCFQYACVCWYIPLVLFEFVCPSQQCQLKQTHTMLNMDERTKSDQHRRWIIVKGERRATELRNEKKE